MVGDIRQAILATNPQEQKNKKYMHTAIWDWFKKQERAGLLTITHRAETWRCRPEIAAFADSLFGGSFGFEPTVSMNRVATAHDGIFLVPREHVGAYVDEYDPLFLRHSASVAKDEPFEFMNIGLSKGMTCRRTLIWPTVPVKEFVVNGKALTTSQAAHLYVAATRAEQSVGFVIDAACSSRFPVWSPVKK